MKKFILALAICIGGLAIFFGTSDKAVAQCNGIFPANSVCGNATGSPAPAGIFPLSVITGPVQWINVKNAPCNATGDGSTDDTAAINTCIAAFNTAGSGVLYFPAGTYKVTAALTTITANGIVRGDGPQNVIGQLGATSALPSSTINETSATASLFTSHSQSLTFQELSLVNTAVSTPSNGAGITVASGTGVELCILNNYDNISVANFYINIDVQAGCTWFMRHTDIVNPVLYGVKIRNTVNSDAGGWTLDYTTFWTHGNSPTAFVRVESSGGGSIVNCKMVNGPPSGSFTYGIDLEGTGVTVDMLISHCGIENMSDTAVRLNGSWHNVAIVGNEFGAYANSPVHGVSVASTSDVTITGNVFGGSFSGCLINISGSTNVFVGGNTNEGGTAAYFASCTKPDHDGTGGIGTFYFVDTSSGPTGAALTWTGASGKAPTLNIQQDAGTPSQLAQFTALNDGGIQATVTAFGSTNGAGATLQNRGAFTSSGGVALYSDNSVSTGGTDDVSIRAGGYTQEVMLIQHNAHVALKAGGGVTPTLTAGCNGAGSAVTGTDAAANVTGQTAAATTCTLTFGTAYAAVPVCIPVGLTSQLTASVGVATTSIVVNFGSTANFKWSYICYG